MLRAKASGLNARDVGRAILSILVFAGISFALLVCVALIILRFVPDAEGGPSTAAPLVFLEPEEWVGERFPLVRHIDIGHDLTEGTWAVLFIDPNCSECRDVEEQWRRSFVHQRQGRFAIVILPSDLPFKLDSRESVTVGRLSRDKDWFLGSPVEIILQDNLVTEANRL